LQPHSTAAVVAIDFKETRTGTNAKSPALLTGRMRYREYCERLTRPRQHSRTKSTLPPVKGPRSKRAVLMPRLALGQCSPAVPREPPPRRKRPPGSA
jgi:hypothetical protein